MPAFEQGDVALAEDTDTGLLAPSVIRAAKIGARLGVPV
jgi:hypothetical protein